MVSRKRAKTRRLNKRIQDVSLRDFFEKHMLQYFSPITHKNNSLAPNVRS